MVPILLVSENFGQAPSNYPCCSGMDFWKYPSSNRVIPRVVTRLVLVHDGYIVICVGDGKLSIIATHIWWCPCLLPVLIPVLTPDAGVYTGPDASWFTRGLTRVNQNPPQLVRLSFWARHLSGHIKPEKLLDLNSETPIQPSQGLFEIFRNIAIF